MSDFEPFAEKNGTKGTNGMSVSVTKEGVYFGVKVTRDVLDDPEYIEWLVDADAARVGFRPIEDPDEVASAYSVSEYAARAAPIWDTIGAEVAETTHVPVDTESEEFPIIDMSEFVEGESDEREGESSTRRFEPGSDHDVLDRERIMTALDSIGIDDVDPEEVVEAVDLQPRIFQVATQLDIARGDADDLVRRLDLEDALDSDQDLARHRFVEGSA